MARPLTPFADWPPHVRAIFEALGRAMTSQRLYPETLKRLSAEIGAILPDHGVRIDHVSGKQLDQRKGHYEILVTGRIYEGRWRFSSGELEKLANQSRAIKGDRPW
jgi:hypothetical protein